ncbi:MAG: hypothetical protein WC661_00595 [Opitutaceae bacterium]|jgi:hypothetical protein
MKKTSLFVVLCLAGLSIANLRAEQAGQPLAPVAPPAAMKSAGMFMPSEGPQAGLTPEQREMLKQAGLELQKDPELIELTAQIKALVEKRSKLAEEKLQKISPEAAALIQTMKATQEKMKADRKAQMEAMQAKMKADHDAAQAADKPAAVTATPAPAPATPSQ